jgi:hypothetical protein
MTKGRTIETDTNTQGDELLTATATDLTRKTIRSTPTQFDKYATSETTETVVDLTGSASSASDDSTVTTDTHTQGAELGEASSSTGVVKQNRSTPTEFGKWQTAETTDEAKEQDTGWESFTTMHGTSYYRRFKNLTSNSANFSNNTDNFSINYSAAFNKYGLYDGGGTAIRRDPDADAGMWRATTTSTKDKVYYKAPPGSSPKGQKRTITYTITNYYRTSLLNIQNDLGGISGVSDVSGISKIGFLYTFKAVAETADSGWEKEV